MNEEKKFCDECNTTNTPLWRNGPHGPRSLCNACGIRYRKRKMTEDKHQKPSSKIRTEESSNIKSYDFVDENQIDESLKMGFGNDYREMGNGMIVLRSRSPSSSSSLSSSSKVKKQRSSSEESVSWSNRDYEEVEQAAALLMSLSCGFVFA